MGIRIIYSICLAVFAVGLAAELWPAVEGRSIDVASLLRLVVLTSVTLFLMVTTGRRKA